MKRMLTIALVTVMTLCALAGCSSPAEQVEHQAVILDKRVVYEQTNQFKLGDIITAPSTYEVYKFDLRNESGEVITKKVDKQDYYDHEIGDIYTY